MWYLVLLGFLGWSGNLEHNTKIIDSRIHRDSGLLATLELLTVLGKPNADVTGVLATHGQNGDLRYLEKIAAYLEHPQHQAAALFAYGEVDGAPIQPLLGLAERVAPANAPLLFEALAKLAGPGAAADLARLWSGADDALKNQALFFLWRQPSAELSQAVIAALSKQETPGDGYLYYLYRGRVPLPATQLTRCLNVPGLSEQALIYATRIGCSDEPAGREALATTLTQLCAHADWRIRVNALNALVGLNADASVAPATRLLKDENPNVVTTAALALAGLVREATDTLLMKTPLSSAQLKALMMTLDGPRADRFYSRVAGWGEDDGWKRRQWIVFQGKITADEAAVRLHEVLKSGTSVERYLAFNALRARKDPSLAALIKPFLYSGDTYHMAAAVEAWVDFADSEKPPFPRRGFHKLASKSYAEPDFHFSYLSALKQAGPADAYQAEVDRLRGHPDYLVRLKALSLTETPKKEQRIQVMEQAWNHDLPPHVRAMAIGHLLRGEKKRWALETAKGRVTVMLRGDVAPITVANIVSLSGRGYFDDMAIHRVVPNFVIQAGDSRGDGSGGPGYAIPCEVNPLRYRRGSVGMALAGKDTGGSQFFIAHGDLPHLDGGYTVFGHVVAGMEIVDKLEEGDRIVRALILD